MNRGEYRATSRLLRASVLALAPFQRLHLFATTTSNLLTSFEPACPRIDLGTRFELTNTGRRMDVHSNLDYDVLRLSLPEGVWFPPMTACD
jgi:hypothetical protein